MSSLKRNIKDKVYHGNGIFLLLRSGMSAQIASWIDMGVGFALFAWVHLYPWLSTAIGAFVGGVVNCYLNYKFTFHGGGCPKRALILKYFLVWVGSLSFNSGGTELLYKLLSNSTFLEEIGFRPDGYYATARLTVSLIVSLFWNFLLQRYFVYQPSRFDPYAVKFVNLLINKNSKH